MKENSIGKKSFKAYFVFVNVLFFLFLFSILYEEILREYIYDSYLPDPLVYPAYDSKTRMIANANEATFFSEWDHIPWYGIFSDSIFKFTMLFGWLVYCIALLFLVPIAIFNVSKSLWKYWFILLSELIVGWFLLDFLLYYWVI